MSWNRYILSAFREMVASQNMTKPRDYASQQSVAGDKAGRRVRSTDLRAEQAGPTQAGFHSVRYFSDRSIAQNVAKGPRAPCRVARALAYA